MRVGITGSFASGKGTVSGMLEEMGGVQIDTDEISREVTAPRSSGTREIVKAFGERYIDDDGKLLRRELGEHVFASKQLTDKLNGILHPLILKETLRKSDGDRIYIVNVPLLFESGFDSYMDYTVVVTASFEQSLDRGISRDGLSEKEIMSRMDRQMDLSEKIQRADYIIDNSGKIENTRRQVHELWNILKNRENG